MGVFKNDVGRPSNEVVKTRMLLKVLGCVIIIFVFFAIGYFIGNIGDSTNSDENNNVSSKVTKKEVDIEEAEKIMTNFFGENYMNYMYWANEDVYNNKEFKTLMAINKTSETLNNATCKELFPNQISNYVDGEYGHILFNGAVGGLCSDSNRGFYEYDDVNKNYHRLFGDNNDAIKESFNIIFLSPYGYSNEEKGYKSLSCECGDAGWYSIDGIISAYESGTILIIELVSMYSENIDVDKNLLKLLDGTTITLTDEEALDKNTYKKYQDNMNKYRFTFGTSNDEYIFIKSEKIK